MKYAKAVLFGISIAAVLTFHPVQAGELETMSQQPQTQIAEIPAVAIRNVTAVRRPGKRTGQAETRKAHPPGAQALMALGIALIVTPAMFRGAFSN
jgi:hypothetical protein